MPEPMPEKACQRCGRTITWRKKWQRDWDQVRYCSQACRGSKLSAVDAALEAEIVSLLEQRTGTICPSEAARRVAGPEGAWRDLMEPARQAARRLVAAGRVEITQKGQVVDGSRARGPIRIRKVT